jgi:hypothetical protein
MEATMWNRSARVATSHLVAMFSQFHLINLG